MLLKQRAGVLASQKGRTEDMALYDLIERLAPLVFAKVKQSTKKVAPNVDFYSGLVYSLLGISEELYTPIFAMARIAGWCAHRIEEIIYGGRIVRPAYRNVSEQQEYVEMSRR